MKVLENEKRYLEKMVRGRNDEGVVIKLSAIIDNFAILNTFRQTRSIPGSANLCGKLPN